MIESMNHDQLLVRGEMLLERLEAEAAKPEDIREIKHRSLEIVSRKIKERLKQIANNDIPRRETRYKEITRIIVDEWPLGSELGLAISEWENCYCKL